MKGIRAIGVVLLCLLGFKTVQGLMDNSSNPNGWVLAWSDEFDTPAIDRTKWDFEINCYGGGNNEKQCYVDKTDNVFQSGGVLNIRPIYWPNGYQGSLENCTDNNQNSCTWTQPATSGRIRTLKSVSGSWVYGRYEIRAKMPRGDFLWPAIWMLPTDWKYGGWAASGEIDIQEFRGQDRYIHLHTLHFGGQWPYNTYEGSGEINSGFDLTADFHTYVLEWDPWEIRWYLDGAEKHRATLERNFWSGNGPNPYNANRQPFDQRFHLILNLAVAGNFFDPGRYGYFDPYYHPTTWSQNFQVDFVRVFRWQD